MNLCFINPSQVHRPEIYELSRHFASEKHNVIILQPSADIRDDFHLQKNVYVKYVPCRFMVLSDLMVSVPVFGRWINTLFRLIQNDQCDLIHVCDYEYLTSIPPIFVKRKIRDVPITIVNDALIGEESYEFHSLPMDLLSKIYTQTLGKAILRSYDRTIFLYSKLAEEANSLGLPREKLEIIPNGIDVKEALSYENSFDVEKNKKEYGIAENEKVILYMGRLVRIKRVEIIIKIVQELLDQGIRVKALIAGEGPQRAKLEEMASSVRSNIIFTGYLSAQKKYECYKMADSFVLPSLSEGLPTVLLEAASFGLPMVATNVNGVPDIIVHGHNGFLVDRWDYYKYSKFVQSILEDENLARKMGINAKRHVEKKFSWDMIVKKYEAVYENLLS